MDASWRQAHFAANSLVCFTWPIQLRLVLHQDGHWAVQHEAMQSFVEYTRSPSSENFLEVIPKELMPGQVPCPVIRAEVAQAQYGKANLHARKRPR